MIMRNRLRIYAFNSDTHLHLPPNAGPPATDFP